MNGQRQVRYKQVYAQKYNLNGSAGTAIVRTRPTLPATTPANVVEPTPASTTPGYRYKF